jgi:hypothetical protein
MSTPQDVVAAVETSRGTRLRWIVVALVDAVGVVGGGDGMDRRRWRMG